MTEVRCECCDLPVLSCGKARETELRRQDRRRRAWLTSRGWFPSQWPGSCERCGEAFTQGTLIRRDPSEDGYRSADCCGEIGAPS